MPLSFNDIDKDDYLSAIIAVYEYNETAKINIVSKDQDKFIENVMNESARRESFKLAGMGISKEEFKE